MQTQIETGSFTHFLQSLFDHAQGTFGRWYGGDPRFVHIPDGTRRRTGKVLADKIEETIRGVSIQPRETAENSPLCPGCYMVGIVDLAIELARRTGQPLNELGYTLSAAFADVAEQGDNYDAALIESIAVHDSPPDHL